MCAASLELSHSQINRLQRQFAQTNARSNFAQLAPRFLIGGELNRFLNGHVGLTADMANRLGLLMGNGAAFWLRVQHEREMWDLLHQDATQYAIEPLERAA